VLPAPPVIFGDVVLAALPTVVAFDVTPSELVPVVSGATGVEQPAPSASSIEIATSVVFK
jgi:hypothetical protein